MSVQEGSVPQLESVWDRFCRKRSAVVALVLMGGLMALVVIWPWVGPHEARAVGTEQYSAPTGDYWLGTDLNSRGSTEAKPCKN